MLTLSAWLTTMLAMPTSVEVIMLPLLLSILMLTQHQKIGQRRERLNGDWLRVFSDLGLLYSASKFYSIIVRRGRRPDNPFFRDALEELGKINYKISLGQAHVTNYLKRKFHHQMFRQLLEVFISTIKESKNLITIDTKSDKVFKKVPSRSPYYMQAIFHLGVVSNLAGRHGKAINYFEKVVAMTRGNLFKKLERKLGLTLLVFTLRRKGLQRSISYYGRVSRNSENWLDALWESSWAFFYMQKFNNTLGNIHTIHSPFLVTGSIPKLIFFKLLLSLSYVS